MTLEEDQVIRRNRPTMISAKYRAREERRRLLKISVNKLKRIEDPEASLCRSVLINNAVRWLQCENRDERTRNYCDELAIASYVSSKENNISDNLIVDMTSDENDVSSRKRLADDSSDELGCKRQRHEPVVLDLQDVFNDFYILPPTPRLLSDTDETQTESKVSHNLDFPEDRLGGSMIDVQSDSSVNNTCAATTGSVVNCTTDSCSSVLFPEELDEVNINISKLEAELLEVSDADRLCDFTRLSHESTKTLEEQLAELQSLDDHFDLTKFERSNNQCCGRAFHDIQTFHSLVPGLET